MKNDYSWNLDTDYLAHHGVQGMKWGVKNGPPYPLSPAISTGSRLKADQVISRYKNSHKELKKDTYEVGEYRQSRLTNEHDFDWREVTLYKNEYWLPSYLGKWRLL